MFSRAEGFDTQKLLLREVSIQRSFHTQKILHREVFTQRSFSTQTRYKPKLVPAEALHTELLHAGSFRTQKPLRTETFAALETEVLTQRNFCPPTG